MTAAPRNAQSFRSDTFGVSCAFLAHSRQNDAFVANGEAKLTAEQMHRINAGEHFYLVGFIDYDDAFDGHHRRGFLRRYDQALDNTSRSEYRATAGGGLDPLKYKNRLDLVIPPAPGYNFDKERT